MKKKAPKKFTKRDPRKITESLPRPEKLIKKPAKLTSESQVVEVQNRLRDHLLDYFTIYLTLLFIILLVVLGFVFVKYGDSADNKRRVEDNYSYWADVVKAHPNITDAYYNAGLYAAQLGNRQKAIEYLDKALKLDPNFVKAQELRGKLN